MLSVIAQEEMEDAMKERIEAALETGATTLSLNYNAHLRDIPRQIKLLRDSLEVLHIDNNYSLTKLPAAVGELPRLRWLNASYCGLTEVDPNVCKLRRLERLHLSNNSLQFLPAEMWQMKALEELRVDNNKLRVLPGALLFLPSLRTIAVENNPLFAPEEIASAAAVTLVPSQSCVDCASCCVRTRNYRVAISFHRLCEHRELPFVYFTCSDICMSHLQTRLAAYDEAKRLQAEAKVYVYVVAVMEGLGKDDLFTLLREHPSEIEVQYMIDQALSKFEAKRLPACLAQHVSSQEDKEGESAERKPNSVTEQREEWIRLYIETQVEEQLTRRLPRLVQDEVAKQLSALTDVTRTNADNTITTSNTALNISPTRRPRPPLPLSPPRSPAAERTLQEPTLIHYSTTATSFLCAANTDTVLRSNNKNSDDAPGAPDVGKTTLQVDDDEEEDDATAGVTVSTALFGASPSRGGSDEAARLQREKILQAVRDVEHQVSSLYRQVNEMAHVQRVARRRLAQLCTALEPVTDLTLTSIIEIEAKKETVPVLHATPQATTGSVSDNTSSVTESRERGVTSYGALYCSLMNALDACDVGQQRTILRHALHSLHGSHKTSADSKPRKAVPEPACATTTIATVHEALHEQASRSSSSSPFDSLPNSHTRLAGEEEVLFEPVQLVESAAGDKTAHVVSEKQQASDSSHSSTDTAPVDNKTDNVSHNNSDVKQLSASSQPPVVMPVITTTETNNDDVEEVMLASTQLGSFSSVSSQEYTPTSPASRLPAPHVNDTPTVMHSEGHVQRGAPLHLGADAIDVAAGLLPSFLGLRGAVCVRHVAHNGLAHRSGIEPGDFVLGIGGVPVQSCAQLTRCLSSFCTPCTSERCNEVTLELFRPSQGTRQVIKLDLPNEP